MDLISFWVWNAKDLSNLDQYLDQCRELFPGKPINLGCYLRNYPEKCYAHGHAQISVGTGWQLYSFGQDRRLFHYRYCTLSTNIQSRHVGFVTL